MREIISINIGQAGVQLSNAAWELLCIEHGIQADGNLKEHLRDGDSSAFKTFFEEVPFGQYVPRALLIDLEPTVIDEVRTGVYRNLFHPDQLITGYEDAANNYGRGHFTIGKQLLNGAIEQIRKAVDNCEILQGFLIINSMGGGTGSGFMALVLENLSSEYGKSTKFQIVVVPSSNLSTAVVEPYNTVLCNSALAELSEICAMYDNEAIFQVCNRSLDIARPTYNNINRILAQVFSSLTVSLRYESLLNSDIDQLTTNLIPYPRIHFPATSYAPIISARRAEHEILGTLPLTRAVFDKDNQLICCDMSIGRYMSCCLQYRGEVTPKDVNMAIYEIKRNPLVRFVSWCPTGFKLGISSQPPSAVPSSEMSQSKQNVTMMTNSTAINQVWERLMGKFDVLFAKRSFVHWYVGEGMEEGEFNEARDEMNSLVFDYIEIGGDEEDGEKEEEKEAPEKEEPKSEKNEVEEILENVEIFREAEEEKDEEEEVEEVSLKDSIFKEDEKSGGSTSDF